MATATNPNATVRRSRRLASQEPEVLALEPTREYNHISTQIAKPRAAREKSAPNKKSNDFDVEEAIEARLAGDRTYIHRLTMVQREAVIDGLADRCNKLKDKVAEVTVESDRFIAEATKKRSLQQAAHDSRIQARMQQQQQPQQQAHVATPPTTSSTTFSPEAASTPVAALPVPVWRKLINVAGSLSPFRRTPAPAPVAPSSPLGELTPITRKRPAEIAENTPKPAKAPRLELTPAPARKTPKLTKTPHLFVGPSAKNHNVPTSLSTIVENTEISRLSTLPESTPAPMSTPSRKPMERRSATANRASRLSNTVSSNSALFAWERTSTPASRPRDADADRRIAKIERKRTLERQLADLAEDSDIIEMESHRLKRVKVENLLWIPHNRPGDSEGTFRLPDFDSDDEMDVGIDVPERSNIFEEAASQPEIESTHTMQQEESVQQSVQTEQQQVEEEAVEEQTAMVFNFPSVGKRRPSQDLSPEELEDLGAMFARGLTQFKAENGIC